MPLLDDGHFERAGSRRDSGGGGLFVEWREERGDKGRDGGVGALFVVGVCVGGWIECDCPGQCGMFDCLDVHGYAFPLRLIRFAALTALRYSMPVLNTAMKVFAHG